MARREEGEYSTYSTDEQRRQRVKDQARWEQNGAVEALGPSEVPRGRRRQRSSAGNRQHVRRDELRLPRRCATKHMAAKRSLIINLPHWLSSDIVRALLGLDSPCRPPPIRLGRSCFWICGGYLKLK